MNWERKKIKDAPIRLIDGDRSSKYPKREEFTKDGVLFLNANSISSGRFDILNVNYITLEKFNTISKGRVIQGDIILTTRGNGVGDCAYYDGKHGDALINAQMLIVRSDKTIIHPIFLFYLFACQDTKVTFQGFASGSAQPQLPISTLKEIFIQYPPLPTQQKIASILSAYDDLIENNLKRIRLLEEAAQHLYREWFVRFRFPGWEEVKVVDGLPEGWEKVNLYEFANLKMGFPFKSEDFNEEKNGTPVIRIRDIPNHWTNTYSKSSTSDDYWVEKNDIVIGMDGFFYTDVWGGQRGYLVQRVCRIRPNDERLNGYLLEAIRGPIKYFEKTISGATVAHLGAKHLKEIEIIKPPEKFVPKLEVLNHMVEQRVNLLLQNQKLKEARDILLPRLMNQTIEV